MSDEKVNRPFEQGEFTPAHTPTATEHAHIGATEFVPNTIDGTIEGHFLPPSHAVWRAGPIEFSRQYVERLDRLRPGDFIEKNYFGG